jgi:hypothetical protein
LLGKFQDGEISLEQYTHASFAKAVTGELEEFENNLFMNLFFGEMSSPNELSIGVPKGFSSDDITPINP